MVAVAMRTLPLYQSPLPFNPDGINHARWAADAVRTGTLPAARMNTDDFLFAPMLAIAGIVFDLDPMQLGQPVSAFVGALPTVLVFAVVHRIGRRCSWSTRRVFFAATFSGLLLAVEGLYLHRSMATDEQTVGLLLVPLAIIAFYRAFTTGRLAWYGVLVVPLVALAPLHNLEGIVMSLAFAITIGLVLARNRLKEALPVLLVTVGFWTYFVGYHVLMERYTAATVHQQSRITDVPGLLLAWVIVFAVGLPWFLRIPSRIQRRLGWGVFGVFFGLLAVNATTAVFPGTPSTPRLLLVALLPLVIPAGIMAWIAPKYADADTDATAVMALLAAVFAIIFLSLSASLAPQYLNTIYRTSTFLHFPVMLFVGIGVVELLRRHVTARALRIAIVGVVLVSVMASIPIAFGGLSVLNYKGVTTTAELSASEFASRHASQQWVGDNHIVRIQPPSGANGSESPVFNWHVGDNPPPSCLIVMQHSWVTQGAQFFPAPPEPVDRSTYRSTLHTRSVVYDSSSADRIVMLAPTASAGC